MSTKSILSITIHGPFAYIDNHPDTNHITLMAPMCADHTVTIWSDGEQSETKLAGNFCSVHRPDRRTYNYEPSIGVTSATGDPWTSGNPCIKIAPRPAVCALDWHLWIKLPRPDFCVGLNPVPVHFNHDGRTDTPTAPVGIRFFYKTWDESDVTLKVDGEDLTFKFPEAAEIHHGQLDIEMSGPQRDDPQHADAMNCFLNLAHSLAKEWTVTYGQLKADGAHGNDCRAPVVWAQ